MAVIEGLSEKRLPESPWHQVVYMKREIVYNIGKVVKKPR